MRPKKLVFVWSDTEQGLADDAYLLRVWGYRVTVDPNDYDLAEAVVSRGKRSALEFRRFVDACCMAGHGPTPANEKVICTGRHEDAQEAMDAGRAGDGGAPVSA